MHHTAIGRIVVPSKTVGVAMSVKVSHDMAGPGVRENVDHRQLIALDIVSNIVEQRIVSADDDVLAFRRGLLDRVA